MFFDDFLENVLFTSYENIFFLTFINFLFIFSIEKN